MGFGETGARRVGVVLGVGAAVVLLGTAACTTATPYGNTEDSVVSGKAREPKEKTGAGTDPDEAGKVAVTKVDPESVKAGSAPSGLAVTVTGTGFDAESKVAIAGRVVATTFTSATSLTATIPPESLNAAGGLALTVVGKTARSNELSLTVYDAGFVLSALDPSSTTARSSSASGSLSLNVTGSGFAQGSVVVFNGTDVPTTVEGATSLRATVPSSLLSRAGQISVSVRGAGTVSAPIVFTVLSGGYSSSSGGGGSCSSGIRCWDLDLAMFECTAFSGTVVQCEDDGCVYNGCF
jgi:hypothetical protein